MVGISRKGGKHLHDRIISLRGVVWVHKTSFTHPLFEVPVPSQESQNRQKDKQRSTKHTHSTKDRVKRATLKTEGELRCPRRVNSSCSNGGTSNSMCNIPCICTSAILRSSNRLNCHHGFSSVIQWNNIWMNIVPRRILIVLGNTCNILFWITQNSI
jgi:hypothetical protein